MTTPQSSATDAPSTVDTLQTARLALLKRVLEALEKDERSVRDSVSMWVSHGAKPVPIELAVKLQRLRQHINRIERELERNGTTCP